MWQVFCWAIPQKLLNLLVFYGESMKKELDLFKTCRDLLGESFQFVNLTSVKEALEGDIDHRLKLDREGIYVFKGQVKLKRVESIESIIRDFN